MALCSSIQFYLHFVQFLKFSGVSVFIIDLKYTCISITRIYLEISEQVSTSGWLDSLPTLAIGNPEYMYSVASISFHHVSG